MSVYYSALIARADRGRGRIRLGTSLADTLFQPRIKDINVDVSQIGLNYDFINSTLSWSDTSQGSTFWERTSILSKKKYDEIFRQRVELTPGQLIRDINLTHMLQPRISNEVPLLFVEPQPLILGADSVLDVA